jgi:MinD-like ATPase involved in chromosome partitioning or flagellar assembly
MLLSSKKEEEETYAGFDVHGPPDLLVISDRDVGLHEAIEHRARQRTARCMYLLSSGGDTAASQRVQSACAAHSIECLPPYRTTVQVAEDIVSRCLGKQIRQSKVIAIAGAQPQTGVTTSVLHMAGRLAKQTGLRIGVLGMNGWNPGDSGLMYKGKYLDEVWGSLHGKQLSSSELPSKMQQVAPSVYYLAGNRDMKKLYYYQPEGAGWLIDCARACFDLVLLDVGSYLDHGLAAQSIHSCDLLLVQLTQSIQAREQWQRTREQVLEPILAFDMLKALLWLNRFREDSPELETAGQLAKQLDLPSIGSLPEVRELLRAEADRNLLQCSMPTRYEAELDKVCRSIMDYYGIPAARGHAMQSREASRLSNSWNWLRRWRTPQAGGVVSK